MDHISCENIKGMRTGNVMFWFATTLAYGLRNGLEVQIPMMESTAAYNLYSAVVNSGFPLAKTAKGKNEPVVYFNHVAGCNHIPDGLKNGALSGYFQNAELFSDYEDDVRRMFRCVTSDTKRPGQLNVHIRLGDYKRYPDMYYTIDADWLKKAIALCEPFTYIKLFSDTPDEAEAILKDAYSGEYVIDDSKDTLACIKSMTEGDQFIISASSMSWWGAWLGKHKRVVYPSPWLKKMWAMAHNTPLPTWLCLPYEQGEQNH